MLFCHGLPESPIWLLDTVNFSDAVSEPLESFSYLEGDEVDEQFVTLHGRHRCVLLPRQVRCELSVPFLCRTPATQSRIPGDAD